MDSICSKRGSHGSNDWRDSVVNQLLAKIDGVEALNNILLIGALTWLAVDRGHQTVVRRPACYDASPAQDGSAC
jgi:hypothetical protein